ncbi:hypothetical protein DB346_14610 [Verrucomicrobia bacterium LW23]|nr:hypothetical protein DB346_14610 [Verrucomicrobia bacterium LW23]
MNHPLSHLHRRKKRRSGQNLVEYSLVLVLMVMYLNAVCIGVTLPDGTYVPGLYQTCIAVFDKVNQKVYAPYGGDYENIYEGGSS